MAEKRMFAKTIIDSDAFLEMPATSQLLYFHLSMRADDEGFVNKPKAIMRTVKCGDDDLLVLSAKGFIIPFESGVVVIKHWKIHNLIRQERINATKYTEERQRLVIKENGTYTLAQDALSDTCQTDVSQTSEQIRLDKIRVDKKREDKSRVDTERSDFDVAIDFFKEHRKKLKKPMTDHAVDLLKKDLEKLAPGNVEKQIELLNYAIKKTWLGVYPMDDKPEPKKQEVNNADRYAITEGFKTDF